LAIATAAKGCFARGARTVRTIFDASTLLALLGLVQNACPLLHVIIVTLMRVSHASKNTPRPALHARRLTVGNARTEKRTIATITSGSILVILVPRPFVPNATM
jgi:hypothetical protein